MTEVAEKLRVTEWRLFSYDKTVITNITVDYKNDSVIKSMEDDHSQGTVKYPDISLTLYDTLSHAVVIHVMHTNEI